MKKLKEMVPELVKEWLAAQGPRERGFDYFMSIIKKYQNSAPVDILAIANELKIKIYKSTGGIESLSGKIIKDSEMGGESGYAIFVNAKHIPERQRFTIAHEIAHYILHKDLIGDGIVDDALYRSGLSNKEEVMANKLAAEILLPWHLINLEMNEQNLTIPKLAEKFQVSISAMSIRLGIPC